MRNEWRSILALCAALTLSPATAGSTADDLAQIEAENAVLKARLRLLDTQAQVAARKAEIERYAPLVNAAMPTLGGVEGLGGRLYAMVVMENGYMAEVRQGDLLPNGMRVVSVRSNAVVVQMQDKTRVQLKPAGDTVRGASAAIASPGVPALGLPLPDRQPPVMPRLPGRPGTDR